MNGQDIILLFLGVGSVALLGIFPVFRTWWRGVFVYPFDSLLFFILFAGVLFLDAARTSSGSELLDPLRVARIIVYTSLTGLAWASLLLRKGTARINVGVMLMFVFAFMAMLTSIYSLYSALTLWKAFEVVTHASVAAVLARNVATTEDAQRILGFSWLALVYVIASLLWGALLYPAEAFRAFYSAETGQVLSSDVLDSGLRGIFPQMHLNSVTQIGAIMAVVASSYLIGKLNTSIRTPMLALLLASLTVMILGHSRSSIFGLALAFAIFAIYARSRGTKIVFVASILVFLVSGVMLQVVTHYLLRGQTQEAFTGLSGRMSLWEHVLPAFLSSPLYGYGYYAAARVLFHIPGTDNSYITVLLGGGVILLVFFLAPIITLMWQLYVSRPGRMGKGMTPEYRQVWIQTAGLFILLFVRSATGPSFDANHFNLILFLICTITASALYRSRRLNVRNNPSPQPQLTPSVAKRKYALLSVRPEKAGLRDSVRGR